MQTLRVPSKVLRLADWNVEIYELLKVHLESAGIHHFHRSLPRNCGSRDSTAEWECYATLALMGVVPEARPEVTHWGEMTGGGALGVVGWHKDLERGGGREGEREGTDWDGVGRKRRTPVTQRWATAERTGSTRTKLVLRVTRSSRTAQAMVRRRWGGRDRQGHSTPPADCRPCWDLASPSQADKQVGNMAAACRLWEGELGWWHSWWCARPHPRLRLGVWRHELWTFSRGGFVCVPPFLASCLPFSGVRNGNRGIAVDVLPSCLQLSVRNVA